MAERHKIMERFKKNGTETETAKKKGIRRWIGFVEGIAFLGEILA